MEAHDEDLLVTAPELAPESHPYATAQSCVTSASALGKTLEKPQAVGYVVIHN